MEKDFLNLRLSKEIIKLGFKGKEYASYIKCIEHGYEDFRRGDVIIFNEGSPTKLMEAIPKDIHTEYESQAVLYQQALDFLDGLGYSISVEHIDNSRTNHWEYSYRDSHDRDYNDEDLMDSSKLKWNTNKYKSRQEAWEAGIKKVIKQIKKQKDES